MATVAETLNVEFEQLAKELDNPELRKLRAQADFLHISQGYYSKLKRSLRPLSEGQARSFARELGRGNENRTTEILSRLLAADAEAASDEHTAARRRFVHEVDQFFTGLHGKRVLLCIDYRDLPRAEQETGKFPQLSRSLAAAISSGLSVALFQPFGNKLADSDDDELSSYLRLLQNRVRRLYEQVRMQVRTDQDINIDSRFVLYERENLTPCGLGSRLFYVERRTDYGVETDVWEWVAADPQDQFLLRDKETFSHVAFARQFHSIIENWRNSNGSVLPLNDPKGEWQRYEPSV